MYMHIYYSALLWFLVEILSWFLCQLQSRYDHVQGSGVSHDVSIRVSFARTEKENRVVDDAVACGVKSLI